MKIKIPTCRLVAFIPPVILAAILANGHALAADGPQAQTIFEQPPAPQELANILFPPKTRALGTNNSEQASPVFGMVINFAFDSANILPESEPMLQALGNMMNIDSVASKSIVVEGHTDASGSAQYNQQLSEKRANAIKQFLINMHDIAPERLVTVGKGETQLYLRSKPDAAINRRATFRPVD